MINNVFFNQRFLDINYPPNALAVFEADFNLLDFIPQFELEMDERDPMSERKYLVKNYID